MMAKKKSKELSPEERLEAALVPEEEWPYEVPGNWCWTRLGALSSNQYGYTAKAVYDDNLPKMLRITDIQEYGVDWESVPNCVVDKETIEKYLLKDGDIVIARTGATTGKSFLLSNPKNAVFASYLIRLRVSHPVLTDCIYLFLQSDLYWKQISDLSSGIAQPGVNSSKLQTLLTPLPPLPEQHRIVERIESLFAKLDEAKEAAQAVEDGFEDRKAAILHKAFTGELTREWRKQPGHLLFRKSVTIKSICKSLKYGTASKSIPTGNIAVIRMGNLQGGEIDWTNLVYSNNEEDNQKYKLSDGDVLFNRTNSAEHVGKTAIYRGEYPAIYAGYLIKLDYDHSIIIGDYLNYLLNSPEAKEYCNLVKSDAVNQSNINAQKIGAFEIPLIGMDEQEELIRVVRNVIGHEVNVKESAESVLDQIDTMKKSILARAFRGELGTNDPGDESAVELVKRTLIV